MVWLCSLENLVYPLWGFWRPPTGSSSSPLISNSSPTFCHKLPQPGYWTVILRRHNYIRCTCMCTVWVRQDYSLCIKRGEHKGEAYWHSWQEVKHESEGGETHNHCANCWQVDKNVSFIEIACTTSKIQVINIPWEVTPTHTQPPPPPPPPPPHLCYSDPPILLWRI